MQAYVITDDMKGFRDRNGDVDGISMSRWAPWRWDAAQASGIEPLQGYLTGTASRKMTCGELGCFAAHMTLWKKIAELPGEAHVLVFEGDVGIAKDAFSRVQAEASGADIVYLAHKLVAGNQALWSCAYGVTPRAAGVLANSCTGAVPADEYLMAACTRGLRASYMNPQAARPVDDAFANSTTEKSPPLPTNEPGFVRGKRFVLATVATDPNNDYFNMLLDTAKLYGVYVRVLGAGEEWLGGDLESGPGGGMKLLLMDAYLAGVHDDWIVCFVDGYDVLLNSAPVVPDAVLAGKVVVARDASCWPNPSLDWQYRIKGKEAYLNSGCYMGLVKHLKAAVKRCCDRLKGPASDDQLAMTMEYLEGDSIVVSDEAFLTMNGKRDHEQSQFVHRGGSRPFALHFNGPSKELLAGTFSKMFVSSIYGVVYRERRTINTRRRRIKFLGNAVPGMEPFHDVVDENEEIRLWAPATCAAERCAGLVDALGDGIRASTAFAAAEPGFPLPVSNLRGAFAVETGVDVDLDGPERSLMRQGICPYGVFLGVPDVLDPRITSDTIAMYTSEAKPGVFKFPLLNPVFCDWLVERAVAGPWSSGTENRDPRIRGGYENVPTKDVHLSDVGIMEEYEEHVFPMACKVARFAFDDFELRATHLAFIVRYDAGTDTSYLRPHHDASVLTLNVGLNDDYEGGGTWFVRHGEVRARKGEAIMHPGRATHKHGALCTTSGTRYVLVAFLE